ncbi:hypothetical protein [Methylibium rhizosphaerae]|uniref:hypothetical protein n=1 Tax=Methylibium rhizosphaerae TaxID=2570323 RepID=UPI0015E353B2|nr:hypothetical protein [Methylibium rhizosphaerae]
MSSTRTGGRSPAAALPAFAAAACAVLAGPAAHAQGGKLLLTPWSSCLKEPAP